MMMMMMMMMIIVLLLFLPNARNSLLLCYKIRFNLIFYLGFSYSIG
ncbi:hypothetical protein HanXRQr2_Chr11g0493891 [Helianthus annuus]|nr:hypothetical protein HanXRQr2_Chr11g0493891 [Helianthus annuus]KAJ0875388.1 hypothetical protein HanPSC8_Chr11g0475821 [Helianthus annuus]